MAVPEDVTTFTTAASAYADAVGTNAADPALASRLAGLPAKCEAAINALRATPPSDLAGAVEASEVLLAQCSDLGDAALSQAPPIARWTVPVPMPLATIAGRFYGADAREHLDELLALNPEIQGAIVVPAGFSLRYAQVP